MFFLFLEKYHTIIHQWQITIFKINVWLKYISTRLSFILFWGVLSGRCLFSRWPAVYYIWNPKYSLKLQPCLQYFELICIWRVWKAGIHPLVWAFILQVFLCYWSANCPFFSDWRKSEGKKHLEREDEGSSCSCFDYFD